MDVYEVTEDTAAIVAALTELNAGISGSVLVIAALFGLLIGYLAFSELLRIWIS